jgi:hypothetical protein
VNGIKPSHESCASHFTAAIGTHSLPGTLVSLVRFGGPNRHYIGGLPVERRYMSLTDDPMRVAETRSSLRFKVLVNGFPDGRAFASLREAREAVAGHYDGDEVEIYDAFRKHYVWARQGYALTARASRPTGSDEAHVAGAGWRNFG